MEKYVNKETIYTHMFFTRLAILFLISTTISCNKEDQNTEPISGDIIGYELLSDISGHWIGENITAFGTFNWFSFDYRPISSSHVHGMYEAGTNQTIITSFFVADYQGRKQIMARNGGWLGNQYRSTYFVMEEATVNNGERYYRVVDAVGGRKRSYIEMRFSGNEMQFDAFKDNAGSLDEPIRHMSFSGSNVNPEFASEATLQFDFPQQISEINMNEAFTDLIDPDSALFLFEETDPFTREDHGHLSEVTINIERQNDAVDQALFYYLSTQPIVTEDGNVQLLNINNKTTRVMNIGSTEANYTSTYLHPDEYYVTLFYDQDNNLFPSSGDVSSESVLINVSPESHQQLDVSLNLTL